MTSQEQSVPGSVPLEENGPGGEVESEVFEMVRGAIGDEEDFAGAARETLVADKQIPATASNEIEFVLFMKSLVIRPAQGE